MRVFITGAGLLGAHTAAQLAERGHEVLLFDLAPDEAYVRSVVGDQPVAIERGSIEDLPTLTDLMLRQRTECVVHTVGLIGQVAQRRPYTAFLVNVQGTVHAAEAARLAGARRLVYTSTHGVYDTRRAASAPMTEDAPTSAVSVYGACKLSAEHLLEAYGRAYDLDLIALRFCNVFGRGLYAAGSRGGEAFNAAVAGPALGHAGTLLPALMDRTEWIYAKDAAQALVASVERDARNGYLLVNVGSGVLSTHEDIVAAVRRVIPDAQFVEPQATGEARRAPGRSQPYDLTRAGDALGFAPRYDLPAAVAEYIAEVRRFGQP